MVKISAFPKCWIEKICSGEMDLHEWIDIAQQLECDGLELYFGFFRTYDDDYLSEVRRHIADCNMEFSMMCASPDFTRPSRGERLEEIEKEKELIRATARLGGRFTRILSGQKRPGLSIEDGVAMTVECIEACLPCAAENGVTLAMENHYKDGYWTYPEFAQKIDVFMSVVTQIDSPYFGVQYDPSNTLVANEDPLELLNLVVSRVKTVHASDRYVAAGYDPSEVLQSAGDIGYHPALRHGVVGKGLNDYDAIFKKLSSVGFDSWVSLEDGMNGMEEMKESVDFLKKMRSKYFSK
ncbi:MAG: sugar phosphate isomerase/epimerase [Synergistaceae bacterium]|jgi:sugar phosphate isomerase/epimerase|nr:sugar phosphate isomerase/epimerase [Synergistaceae bacterium]